MRYTDVDGAYCVIWTFPFPAPHCRAPTSNSVSRSPDWLPPARAAAVIAPYSFYFFAQGLFRVQTRIPVSACRYLRTAPISFIAVVATTSVVDARAGPRDTSRPCWHHICDRVAFHAKEGGRDAFLLAPKLTRVAAFPVHSQACPTRPASTIASRAPTTCRVSRGTWMARVLVPPCRFEFILWARECDCHARSIYDLRFCF